MDEGLKQSNYLKDITEDRIHVERQTQSEIDCLKMELDALQEERKQLQLQQEQLKQQLVEYFESLNSYLIF